MSVGAIEHDSHGMHLDLYRTSKYFNPHSSMRDDITYLKTWHGSIGILS